MHTRRRRLAGAGLLLFGTVALSSCTSKAAPAPAAIPTDVTAYVTIKELMENMIDPIADNIFDAVGTDVTDKGVVDTKPVTDQDWAKVRQGAVTLAEGTNLLKMPRGVAPPGDTNKSTGPNAPELSPEQIQAKIDQDRALWNKHVNQLRDDAMKVLAIVKAKDVDALFQAGSDIDRACENCHLEYWYPGDKKAVLEDERQHATITPPRKQL
jgi:cytochrome c556